MTTKADFSAERVEQIRRVPLDRGLTVVAASASGPLALKSRWTERKVPVSSLELSRTPEVVIRHSKCALLAIVQLLTDLRKIAVKN